VATTLLIVLEFILSVLLIVVVLLQQSKGEGLGAIGGGGQLFFGKSKAAEAFLDKATTWLAVAFLVVSILFVLV